MFAMNFKEQNVPKPIPEEFFYFLAVIKFSLSLQRANLDCNLYSHG